MGQELRMSGHGVYIKRCHWVVESGCTGPENVRMAHWEQ